MRDFLQMSRCELTRLSKPNAQKKVYGLTRKQSVGLIKLAFSAMVCKKRPT